MFAYLNKSDIGSGLLYYRKQHAIYLGALEQRVQDGRDVDATESTKQPGEHEVERQLWRQAWCIGPHRSYSGESRVLS